MAVEPIQVNEDELVRFAMLLKEFTCSTAEVWRTYKDAGIKPISPHLYERTVDAMTGMEAMLANPAFIEMLSNSVNDDLNQWRQRLSKAVATAHDLTYRCACTPIGLNFVTGEAGLIPRRDQHAAFESVLQVLDEKYKNLVTAISGRSTKQQ